MLIVNSSQSKKYVFVSICILAAILFQIWIMGNILPLHLAEQCSEQITIVNVM